MSATKSLAITISDIRRTWSENDSSNLEALAILDLPDSDGEPMENERERIQINLGIE